MKSAVGSDQKRPRHRPPEVERIRVPRGELCIITDWCKGCGFCIEFCPRDVLASSEAFNRKGYHPPKVVKAEECRNCDLCEMLCPDFAIFTVRLAAALAEQDDEEHGPKESHE
jgi:2-oxoglutarate ferredoxin oxidoreductase subunit delta